MSYDFIDGVLYIHDDNGLKKDVGTFFYSTLFDDYSPTLTYKEGEIVYTERENCERIRGKVKEIRVFDELILVWWDYFDALDFKDKLGGQIVKFQEAKTILTK